MAMTEVSMSSNRQYTDEFRSEAVKQVLERGFTVVDVAGRIGIPKHTLYGWVQAAKKAACPASPTVAANDSAEVRRLKAELRRVTEERDILKKAAALSTGRCNIIGVAADREGKCDDGSTWIVIGAEAGTVDALARRCFVQRDCP